MGGDARWYEAAHLTGITSALNVTADAIGPAGAGGLLAPVEAEGAAPEVARLFADIRDFYGGGAVPLPFRLAAHDPGYCADLWAATRRAFADNQLSRRLKEALAFAVSLATRSPFGTAFHLAEMRRLGVSPRGVLEVLGVAQMFASYTKIADTLQLEPDMGDIAPEDLSPPPGGGTG